MFGRGRSKKDPREAIATIGREPWTVKVAVWSARHRWPVLGLWFVMTLGLMFGSVALGGQRSPSITDSNGRSYGQSQDAWKAESDAKKAAGITDEVKKEDFWLIVSDPKGLNAGDKVAITAMTKALQEGTAKVGGQDLPILYKDPKSPLPAAVDPFALASASPNDAPRVLSADGTTATITGKISGESDEAEAKAIAARKLASEFKASYPNLTIYAFNNRLINKDFGEYVNGSLDSLLLPTLLITFLILLLAFRVAFAPVVPLALALSSIIGAMGLVGIYSQTMAPVSQFVGQIVVLIGLAVAVDYSLFIISRFRTERAAGKPKFKAIEVASATAGRAVLFSGLAVMISLGALLLIDDDVFKSIAIGSLSVVLISVVGSLTFLPAAISVMDRWLLRLALPIPGGNRGEGRGIWAAVVRTATNKAVVACVGTAVLLVAIASPVSQLHLGSTTSDVTTLPKSVEGVRAWQLIMDKWPQGFNQPLQVVVTNANAPAVQEAVAKIAATTPQGVSGKAEVTSPAPGMAQVEWTLPGTANDRANWDTINRFRNEIVPQYFGSIPNTQAFVTGQVAYTMDYSNWYGGQVPMLFLFVLGLSFLLLLVAFHSIVIPLKAIVLNMLSAGAAFGVLVLVFQEGWFREFTGIRPNVVEAWAPAMIFTILFGLSMDYEVFILTRIKEARDRGLESSDAVLKGITITSGTVTSAAAIMVVVFAAFCTVQLSLIQELGLGLAVAVLVDATLVRSLLLPSTMKLLGEWNWYMPSFLRWIPRITIEGEPEEVLAVEPEFEETEPAAA